ncbi:MAG: DUF45 domain-containing protein [Lachnospiraceae bacterium]|nr:DUF45 domain-containing protein [Lachnospiraceae bacterium]
MCYDYEVIRSNRKTMSMGFKGTRLIVRAPLRATDESIRIFINQNSQWINEHYKKAQERELEMNEVTKLTHDEINELKKIAEEVIPKRVAHYARLIGVTYGKISIGTQRTLWGSCSSKGNLNFNCILMLTPIEVIDSVIVHELCHRKEMNHSNRFYAEVLRAFPDYWTKNKWLTEHAFMLKAMLKGKNEAINENIQKDGITRTSQKKGDIQWKSKSIGAKQGLALLIQSRITCNSYHTVFVRLDGTVAATERGYSNAMSTLFKWTNILAVAAEGSKILGLRSNGYIIGVDAESGKRDYQKNKASLLEGYKMARKFLFSQYVFRMRDLPYSSQLIPLAAICAEVGKTTFNQPQTQNILSRWFWCGIMGEMYGGANETRFANDMEDVVAAIHGQESQNRTINTAYFSATRLISLQTRNSAAYKGIMALVYRERCHDFVQGTTIDIVKSMDEAPDIHHIFPEAYCINKGYKREKWNSIINKTPLLPESNRQIGGEAPSIYSKRIMRRAEIDELELRARVESHLVDYDRFIEDDFDGYFIARAKALLSSIEKAMGKSIADKGSEQTINVYGVSLEDNS